MSHNMYTFLYFYFASFVLVFRFDAVFASADVPESCVGHSCKDDLSNDHDGVSARQEVQKSVQSQQEWTELERRDGRKTKALELEKRPGSDGMEIAEDIEDMEMFSDHEDSDQQSEPSGASLHEIRIKQQQKAVEEARKNFLNRRMGTTHSSDHEVEGNQEPATHDFLYGNENSNVFDGEQLPARDSVTAEGEGRTRLVADKDGGYENDDQDDDESYEGQWENDDDEFFDEDDRMEDSGSEDAFEVDDEDGHHIISDDIGSIDTEVNMIDYEGEQFTSSSLSDNWRTSAQMKIGVNSVKASFASKDDIGQPEKQPLEAPAVPRPKSNSLLAGMIRRGSEAVKREKDGTKSDPVGKVDSTSEDFSEPRDEAEVGVNVDGTPLTLPTEHPHLSKVPVTISGSVQKADNLVDERRDMRTGTPTAVPLASHRPPMPPDLERPQIPTPERLNMQPLEGTQIPLHEGKPVPPSERPQIPLSDRQSILPENPQMPPSKRTHMPHSERPQMPPSERPQMLPSERQQMPPSDRQQMPPSDRQRMPPSNRQQVPPSERQQMPPSERQQVPPSERQHMPPSDRQQMPPSERQQMPPSERQHMPPSDRQQMPPSDRQQMPPSELQQVTPSDRQQMPPSFDRQQVPPSDRQQVPPSDRQQMPPFDRQQMPPFERQQVPPSDQQRMLPSDRQRMPPSDRQQMPPYDRHQVPPSDRQQKTASDKQQMPPSERQQVPPSDRQQIPPSQRPPMPPTDRKVMSHSQRTPASSLEVPSMPRLPDVEKGMPPEKPPLSDTHITPHAHGERHVPSSVDRNPLSEKLSVQVSTKGTNVLAVSSTTTVPEGTFERASPQPSSHDLNNVRESRKMAQHESQHLFEMEENHRKEEAVAQRLERDKHSVHDSDERNFEDTFQRDGFDRDDLGSRYVREGSMEREDPRRMGETHPHEKQPRMDDERFSNVKTENRSAEIDVANASSGDDGSEGNDFGKRTNISEHAGSRSKDTEYAPADYNAGKDSQQNEGNTKFKETLKENYRFRKSDVGEREFSDSPKEPFNGKDSRNDDRRDFDDMHYDAEKRYSGDRNVKKDLRAVQQSGDEEMGSKERIMQRFDGDSEEKDLDEDEDRMGGDDKEMTGNDDDDDDDEVEFQDDEEGARDDEDEHSEMDEDDVNLDEEKNWKINDTDTEEEEDHGGSNGQGSIDGYDDSDAEFNPEENDERLRHDAIKKDSIDGTAESDFDDGAYSNEVDDGERNPGKSVIEDFDPEQNRDAIGSTAEDDDDFRRASSEVSDSSDWAEEPSGQQLSDSIAGHGDDNSLFSHIFATFDRWSETLLAMLPSTLQALFAYSPFPLSPARTFAIFLISCVTFFAIRLRVYCRKSDRANEKPNATDHVDVSNLRKKLSVLQQERDSFQKQVNGLQVQRRSTAEAERKGAKIIRLSAATDGAKKDVFAFVKDLQGRSNAESKDSSSQLRQVMKERDGLKQNISLLNSQIQQLSSTIDAQNQALGVEREQNLSYQQVNGQLSIHITYLESQLSDLTNRCSFAQSKEAEMQSQVQCMTEEVSVLQMTKDQLQLELDEWKEIMQKMSQKMNRMRQDETIYKERIVQKEQEIQAMQDFFAQLQPKESMKTVTLDRDNEASGVKERESEIEIRTKESLQEMLKSVVEISEIRKKMKDLEHERDSLKSLMSSEFENRSKLEVEVKQLKETVEQKTRNLEMAEKKTKDLEVQIDVLTSFFREKESDLNQKLSMQRERGFSKSTNQLNEVDDHTRELEFMRQHYKERAENFEKEMHKAEAEHRKQLAAQEKKAHENWLLARQWEREAKDYKNEASTLKLKIVELQNHLEDLVADKSNAAHLASLKKDTDSMKGSSSMLPDLGLARPPLHPQMHPAMIPPRFDGIFPPDVPPFYVPPMANLPFPPHLFDIPPSHGNPYFDVTYAMNHRRSLPFNVHRPSRQEHGSPELSEDKFVRPSYRRSPSAPGPYSPESSASLNISPMPTGNISPHAGIMSPPKIIDRPGPGGPRPLAIRPQRSIELNESRLE